MIKSVTMYSVVCDRCGKTFIEEFNGIVAWLDEGTAKEQAMESEWAGVPFGIFVSRYKRIVVLMSKFDKEK